MIKLGVMKIGANITWSTSSVSAANFDIQSIVRALDLGGNFDFTLISRKTSRTVIPKKAKWHDIMEGTVPDVDALLVFNGNPNFYGGAEAPDQILNYKIINAFKGPVIIVNTDGELYLKQVWPAIHKRTWASNWKESEIVIERDDIMYLTQGYNIDKTYAYYAKKSNVPFKKENMVYFPIDQAIHVKPPRIHQRTKRFDLIYGGAPRTTARRKAIKSLLIGHRNITTHLFGAVSAKNLGINPSEYPLVNFGTKVANASFPSKLTEGYCSLAIGDDLYCDNFITLRFHEILLAEVVLLIHEKFDPKHRFFGQDPDMDCFYVSSRKELGEVVEKMKFKGNHTEVAAHQRKIFSRNFQVERYCSQLALTVEHMIN